MIPRPDQDNIAVHTFENLSLRFSKSFLMFSLSCGDRLESANIFCPFLFSADKTKLLGATSSSLSYRYIDNTEYIENTKLLGATSSSLSYSGRGKT